MKWLLIAFIALAGLHGGAWYLAAWLGGNLMALGYAHGMRAHRFFGKRANGTLPVSITLWFLPLHLLSLLIWKLGAIFSRKAPWQMVTPCLLIGRRLSVGEPIDKCNSILLN